MGVLLYADMLCVKCVRLVVVVMRLLDVGVQGCVGCGNGKRVWRVRV